MSDLRQRFYFENGPVRGECVRLDAALTEVFDRHDYPEPVRLLLGQMLVAAVLLTATLKLRGRLSLQARGDGALGSVMAECSHEHDIRGIARLHENVTLPRGNPGPAALLGRGMLVITLEPEDGPRYQGIVPLEGETLAACLEAYFARSEQIPTRLWLAADRDRAGGLLLQVLPGSDHDEDADLWPRAAHLGDTVTPEELLELPPQELLYRLYHEEEVRLPEAEAVRFACSCSRERTAEALVSIGRAEAEDIAAEQGEIRLHCEFCHTEYVFTPGDVRELFRTPLH